MNAKKMMIVPVGLLAALLVGCGGEQLATSQGQVIVGPAPPVPAATADARPEPQPVPPAPAPDTPAQPDAPAKTGPAQPAEPEPEPAPEVVPEPGAPGAVAEERPSPVVIQPPQADGTGPILAHGGPVRDHVSLVDNLRARGFNVVPESPISQPFLSGDGTSLVISGLGVSDARLQSFQYESAAAAAADAAKITPEGNIGPSGGPVVSVHWIAPPHFFLKGRVLVIYVGSDPTVLGVLTDLMGPQFAGS